jgi:hypothetical protein
VTLVERTREETHAEYRSVILPAADEVYDDLWEGVSAKARDVGWDLRRDFTEVQAAGSRRIGHPGRPVRWQSRTILGWDGVWEVFREYVAGRPSTDAQATLYLRRTGHLNEQGHELVARALAGHLPMGPGK